MTRKHYIVAGGGLAGLSAAIELAQHGSVALYEQSKTLGGRAATHRQQGFAINLGPHACCRSGVMKAQFDAWGLSYSGKPPLGSGKAFLISEGVRQRFPANAVSLFRSRAFSLRDKMRLGKLMSKLAKASARAGESMQACIERMSSSPKVRQMLEALTRLSTYAADLDVLDAGPALVQVQMALKQSVLYIDGGWQTLVTALNEKAQALGVTIHLDCGVTSVTPGSIQLRSGQRVAANGVVLAMPPQHVAQVTGWTLPALTPARAACLDLGLRRLPPRAGTFGLGLDEPTYVSVHSEYAKALAPEGGALVHVAMYLSNTQSCTRDDLEHRADLILPGWRDELIVARFLPQMTVTHAIPRADGPRPDVDALNMPSVLLAGDWVGPKGMLADAAVASAIRAASRLIHDA